jgi:ribosome-associated protein
MTGKLIEGVELARACALAADEIQAENIRLWDLRGISTLTDFMVVCSGNSMPHLRAVLRDVEHHVWEWHRVRPVNAEGKVDSRWVVLDYVDVMVHIMHGELREHYGLERLWGDAKEVAWAAAPSNKEQVATKPRAVKKTAVRKTAVKKTAVKKAAAKKTSPRKSATKKAGGR